MTHRYRYAIRKDEWNNSEDDWNQLVDYARTNFTHVVEGPKHLYFNATPEQLRRAASILRIGTTFFCVLTDASLEPSLHDT